MIAVALGIHTLQLGRYDILEKDLPTASLLECWIYWLLHAHEYEPEELLKLFPQEAIREDDHQDVRNHRGQSDV